MHQSFFRVRWERILLGASDNFTCALGERMFFEQSWMFVVHWLQAFYSSYLFLVVSIVLFVAALTRFIKEMWRFTIVVDDAACAWERRYAAVIRKRGQKRESQALLSASASNTNTNEA